MIEIVAIELTDDNHFSKLESKLLTMLPSGSRKNFSNIKSRIVYQRSLLGEILARKRVSLRSGLSSSEIDIIKSEKGKPYLKNISNLFFNISHSGNWVVVAISDKEIGIDVEKIKRINIRIAERFFSNSENEFLKGLKGAEKDKCFFDLWTLKESYLKLLGKGLTKSLSSFSILKHNDNFFLFEEDQKIQNVFFKQYPIQEGYKLSVGAFDNNFPETINIHTIDDLLK